MITKALKQPGVLLAFMALTSLVLLCGLGLAAPAAVKPTLETQAATGSGDVADDCCIWIHPTDPAQSTIIGMSKDDRGGLEVFDLTGARLQFYPCGKVANVDLRYNFPLGGQRVALVVSADRASRKVIICTVNPSTRLLEDAAGATISFPYEPYGCCLYHSPRTGKYYLFVNNKSGRVEQIELFDNGHGKVDGKVVRGFGVGSQTEGCVADDGLAKFYLGEEDVAVWKFGAEPGDGTTGVRVDTVGAGGHLVADVEGLCIYYASNGAGYLIASSQGDDRHVIYRREGNNELVGDFVIVANGGIDAVSETDGCDVTNFPLGGGFPSGVYVAHDASNSGAGTSNYKLVPWDSVARAFSPVLIVDTTWDPRGVGK